MGDKANKKLIHILSAYKEKIIQNWLEHIHEPYFSIRPRKEIEDNIAWCFSAFQKVIEASDYEELEKFVSHLAKQRYRIGLPISRSIHGVFGFKKAIKPILEREYSRESGILSQILEVVDITILDFYTRYADEYERISVEHLVKLTNELEQSKATLKIRAKKLEDSRSAMIHILKDMDRKNKQLIKLRKELEKLVIMDDLTGLYNRRHFFNQLEEEIKRSKRLGRPISLLILDIDDFKEYNDKYGHLQGDQVLKKLGEVIKGNIREIDSAYRHGGEEFAIILLEANIDHAIKVAERIRGNFEEIEFAPITNDGKTEYVHKTISIGISQYEGQDIERFVTLADDAMYMAKREGKNRVCTLQKGGPNWGSGS